MAAQVLPLGCLVSRITLFWADGSAEYAIQCHVLRDTGSWGETDEDACGGHVMPDGECPADPSPQPKGARLKTTVHSAGTFFFLLAPFFFVLTAVLDLAAWDFVTLDLTDFFFTEAYSSSFVTVARPIAGRSPIVAAAPDCLSQEPVGLRPQAPKQRAVPVGEKRRRD